MSVTFRVTALGGCCGCMAVEKPWLHRAGPFSSLLHKQVYKMFLSPCRGLIISDTVGSFQSG